MVSYTDPGAQELSREPEEDRANPTNHMDSAIAQMDLQREECLRKSRDLIKMCARTIHAIHQGRAHQEMIDDCTRQRDALSATFGNLPPENAPQGAYLQSMQEYCEALIVWRFSLGEDVPDISLLGTGPIAYLYGLSDAIGELRRMAVQALLDGDLKSARETLNTMDSMFNMLMEVGEYGIAKSLKNKRDQARNTLERTRADVMRAAVQGTPIRGDRVES